jgi:hypothetical protein
MARHRRRTHSRDWLRVAAELRFTQQVEERGEEALVAVWEWYSAVQSIKLRRVWCCANICLTSRMSLMRKVMPWSLFHVGGLY